MKQYLTLLQDILDNGRDQPDRTGTGCRSVFGRQLRFDLSHGKIPLLTTKLVPLRAVAEELIWIMSGNTNSTYLSDRKVMIWEEWALKEDAVETVKIPPAMRHLLYCDKYQITSEQAYGELMEADSKVERPSVKYGGEENGAELYLTNLGIPNHTTRITHRKGDLGPIYGKQMRDRHGVDQLKNLLESLKNDPFSRRHIIDLWSPEDLPIEGKTAEENVLMGRAALPACHAFVQWHVDAATLKERQLHLTYLTMGESPRGVEIVEYLDAHHGEVIDWPELLDRFSIPKYRLSCQLYQR